MKTFLLALFLMLSLVVSSQQIFQEKIGTGYSYYSVEDSYNQSIGSRGDFSFGVLMMDRTKKITFRKGIEMELFRLKGNADSGGLGGHTYYKNINGYSLILSAKLQPLFRSIHGGYWFAGPVVGSNLKTFLEYDYNWYLMYSGAGSGHESKSAGDYFSRCFFGFEIGFGNTVPLHNGNEFGIEVAAFGNINFAKGFDHETLYNRLGVKIALVNPTGLVFKKKANPAG